MVRFSFIKWSLVVRCVGIIQLAPLALCYADPIKRYSCDIKRPPAANRKSGGKECKRRVLHCMLATVVK